MPAKLEDIKVLRTTEELGDRIWRDVLHWKSFEKDVVGKQLVRSIDSIGANIAESYGRFHYGEKLRFLYYARGSLYESKYWLNRAVERDLLEYRYVSEYQKILTTIAKQINAFARDFKTKRVK